MEKHAGKYKQKLKELYSITGVPCALISISEHNQVLIPEPPSEEINDYQISIIYNLLKEKQVPVHTPYLSCIASSTLICILQLNDDLIVVFGPVALHTIDMHQYLSYMTQRYDSALVSHHMKLVQGSPKVDYYYFSNIAILATDFLCNKTITSKELILSDSLTEINDSAIQRIISRNQISIQNLSFDSELYDLVKTGNVDVLKQKLEKLRLSSYYLFQENALHVLRLSLVFYGSILSHYAHLGGLSGKTVKEIYSKYIRKLTVFSSPEYYWRLLSAYSLELCQKVHALNQPAYDSDILRASISFIEENIYLPITVKDLEELTHSTSKTISRHFMKHLGITPSQYISDAKLKEAAYLLRESNLRIVEIAHLLNYSSQSHFNKNFYKYYQCTPLQYRNAENPK